MYVGLKPNCHCVMHERKQKLMWARKCSGLLYRFSCCLFIVYGQIQWSIMIHLGYSIFHYKWVILCFLHSFRGNRTLSYKPPSELTFVCFDDLYLSEELCSGSVCSCEYMFFFPPNCIDLILICQGGNVCASVCLLDCQQDYTKTTKQICMKLGWLTVLDPQETTFGFGADLDKRDGSRRRVLGLSRHLR